MTELTYMTDRLGVTRSGAPCRRCRMPWRTCSIDESWSMGPALFQCCWDCQDDDRVAHDIRRVP